MNKLISIVLLLLAVPLSAQESRNPEQQPGEAQASPVSPPGPPASAAETEAGAIEQDADAAPPAPVTDQVVPVAEDESEEDDSDVQDFSSPALGSSQVPAEMSAEEELIYQYERYVELMQDEVFDEADSVAKRVVELVIEVKGPNSTDFARALTNLAIVQHRTDQYRVAQQNFESAIEILEGNQDRLSEDLVNPLRGLGAAQLESGRPDQAGQTFRRAVHITHVNEGPHNLEQIDILESLSESYLRLGAIDEAKQVQDVIYALNERAYASNTMEMLPSLMRRAKWQQRAGLINDQRTTLRRAIRIIEDEYGKDDVRLVAPLTQLGESYFYIDLSGTPAYASTSMSTGEVHFKRALRIANENPKASWKMVADTALALGDYYMYLGNELRAHKIYEATWKDLSANAERRAYRAQTLEQPALLREGPLPAYVSPPGEAQAAGVEVPYSEGTITVTYDVSAKGRAANVDLIEAQPPEFTTMQRRVQREIRSRIYRPRYSEAEAVVTKGQVLVHKYFYLPSELDALRNGDAGESEDT